MSKTKKRKLFYGYIIVTAVFFIITITRGGLNSFGVFLAPVLDEFGWTRAMTSGAFSLQMLIAGLLSLVVGVLNDRFGPRIILTICAVMMGLGYLLMSRIQALWELYLYYGVIVGIGLTGNFVPMMSTVARWFSKKRGTMSGIALSSVGIGTVVMPLVANWFIANYNWRVSFVSLGIISFVVILIAAQFLRRDPQSMGLLPDGEITDKPVNIREAASGLTFRQAVRTAELWILAAIMFLTGYSIFTVTVHIVIHATGIGIPNASAVSILAIGGAFNVPGRLAIGTTCDKAGTRNALMISLSVMLLALIWLQFVRVTWMAYLFGAVFGLAWGGALVVGSPLIAELFGLKAHGAILAIVNASITIGGTIGPVITGYIYDLRGSYQLAYLICIVVSLVSLVLTWLLRARMTDLKPNEG